MKNLKKYIRAINFMIDKVNESEQYDKLILLCSLLQGFNLDETLFDFNLDNYTFTIRIEDDTGLLGLSDFVDVWCVEEVDSFSVPSIQKEVNISKFKNERL